MTCFDCKKMPVERRRRLSRCHGSKISGSQQTVVLADKKNEKIAIYDFVPVHDCIYRNKTVRFFHRSTMRMAVSINERLLTCKNFNVIVM